MTITVLSKRIRDALAQAPDGMTASELALALDIGASQISRSLALMPDTYIDRWVQTGALPSVCARRLPTPMTPTFNTWERQTLDKFALEAYLRLQQQQEQLEQLRGDLKDAIEAYRALNKGSSASLVND